MVEELDLSEDMRVCLGEMKEHSLLFKTLMVEALLEDRKFMTRRLMTKRNSKCAYPLSELDFSDAVIDGKNIGWEYLKVKCPSDGTRQRVYCRFDVGDLMWCKETWVNVGYNNCQDGAEDFNSIVWKASQNGRDWQNNTHEWRWKSPLFLRKEAARIWLQITKVLVERLQDISEEDAIAEGIESFTHNNATFYKNYLDDGIVNYEDPRLSFKSLWISING